MGCVHSRRWLCPEVIHIPVTDMEPPTFEAVERFIDIANDVTRRPMYVHCKAGIGRTGSMVSCWRISQGMDVEEAGGGIVYSSSISYHHHAPTAEFTLLRVSCTLRVFKTSVARLFVRRSVRIRPRVSWCVS